MANYSQKWKFSILTAFFTRNGKPSAVAAVFVTAKERVFKAIQVFWDEPEKGGAMPLTRQHIQGERPTRQRRFNEGVVIREEDIQQFLADYERMNRTEGTVQFYRRKMKRFYEDLPEDKTVRYGTLQNWRDSLLRNGYTPGSANAFLSAANAYLDYIGHREYQLAGQLKEEKAPVPELSRAEYLHLLRTARALGKEKIYLLIKLFGSTGLFAQELPEITVEAVQTGKIVCDQNKYKQIVTVPACLQKELLDYAKRNGIISGPIFQTRDGRPMHRTYVSAVIRNLCEKAQISSEKGNPKSLRKLYLSTKAGIENNVALLVEQAMERMMEQEQFSIGWEEL